jgi:hypothetical protein
MWVMAVTFFVTVAPSPRHARPWGGHPRLAVSATEVVDGRAKPGHDEDHPGYDEEMSRA